MEELKFGKYRHYSGKEYKVIGLVRHTETLEVLVLYQALYNSSEFGADQLWVRPKQLFLEPVVIDGVVTPRFEYSESTDE